MIVDNAEGVAATESLIAWLKSQEIGPIDAIPILAATIVVAVVSHAKEKKWTREQTLDQIVIAGECVLDTYRQMRELGKNKNED